MTSTNGLGVIRAEVLLTVIVVILLFSFVWISLAVPNKNTDVIDLSLRNPDFPSTYISHINVDLTSPNHWVKLVWQGEQAETHPIGPFRSSPGAGVPGVNCDDEAESNRENSNCTPKGRFLVEQLDDRLENIPECRYVTVISIERDIALHSHWDIPARPASHGCIRLDEFPAQLIHNNSLVGVTEANISGHWSDPSDGSLVEDLNQ